MATNKMTADVVVIGGGILGISVAYALAQRGLKNIILLEKDSLASGSTGKTSGFIRQHYAVPEVVRMARKSLDYFRYFNDIVGEGETDFKRTGLFILVSPKDTRSLEINISMQKGLGVWSEVIAPNNLKSYFGEKRIDIEGLGAIGYEIEAGYADGHSTVISFAKHCRDKGVKIYQGTEVISIKRSKDGINKVITNKETFCTSAVVNAAGPWAKKIGKMAGIELPLEVRRHPIGIVRNPPNFGDPLAMYVDFTTDVYFRSEGSLLTLIGFRNFISEELVNPEGYSEGVSFGEVANFSEKIWKRIPDMENCSPLQRNSYAGLITLTPDGYPILGASEEVPGFYLACGGSGHCFKFGPVIGEMVADSIIGKTPEFDVKLFSLKRFRKNNLIKEEYQYGI